MPTAVYDKLSDSKKQNIATAFFKQLIDHTMSSFSINQLCIDSKIAHGSFYAYFKDKEEFFDHMFSSTVNMKKSGIINIFQTVDTWKDFIKSHFLNIMTKQDAQNSPVNYYIEYVMHKSEQQIDDSITPFALSYEDIATGYSNLFTRDDKEMNIKIIRMSRILFEQAVKNVLKGMEVNQILQQLIDDITYYEKGIHRY